MHGHHDDRPDALAYLCRLQLWQAEMSLRASKFYSLNAIYAESLWAMLWCFMVWLLLALVDPSGTSLEHRGPGLAFIFAGLAVGVVACHGYLIRRARAFNGHWDGRFRPHPHPVQEHAYAVLERSLTL